MSGKSLVLDLIHAEGDILGLGVKDEDTSKESARRWPLKQQERLTEDFLRLALSDEVSCSSSILLDWIEEKEESNWKKGGGN